MSHKNITRNTASRKVAQSSVPTMKCKHFCNLLQVTRPPHLSPSAFLLASVWPRAPPPGPKPRLRRVEKKTKQKQKRQKRCIKTRAAGALKATSLCATAAGAGPGAGGESCINGTFADMLLRRRHDDTAFDKFNIKKKREKGGKKALGDARRRGAGRGLLGGGQGAQMSM